MSLNCGVVSCGSNNVRDNVSFYRLPQILNFKHKKHLNELSVSRRQKWLNAIKRSDLTETKIKLRVCGRHFISGKPAKLEDLNDPDWVPSLHMGYNIHSKEEGLKKLKRGARFKDREIKKQKTDDGKESNDNAPVSEF